MMITNQYYWIIWLGFVFGDINGNRNFTSYNKTSIINNFTNIPTINGSGDDVNVIKIKLNLTDDIEANDKDYLDVPANEIFELHDTIQLPQQYNGSQLWKLHTTDLNGPIIKKIKKKYGGKIWDMNQDGIDIFFVNGKRADDAKKYMATLDITYNIMIQDIQKAIEDTNSIYNFTKETVPWIQSDELQMTWNQYHNINVFDDFYHYIITNFPKIGQLLTIGRTYQQNDIKILKLSNGNTDNQVVFIDSGMQGSEWIGPAAITLAISKLLYNWKTAPDYLRNIDWYFLPIVNIDGYQYSRTVDRLWNKNRRFNKNDRCAGVNIDRNFSYQWGKRGSTNDPCSTFFRGTERFSEPESIAIKNILSQIDNKLAAYISIGSYGQMITYPWGDDDFVPGNHKTLSRMAQKIANNIRTSTRAEYQTGSSYSMKFARSGNSADWVLDTYNPNYVFNFYLRDQGRYGYLLPPNFIIQSGFEVFEMLRTIAEDLDIVEL